MKPSTKSTALALAALALLIISSIAASAQQKPPFVWWLFGNGSATENDRASADSEALDQATDQVNSACVGDVEAVVKTGDSCVSTGGEDTPSFTCTVIVKGKCLINKR